MIDRRPHIAGNIYTKDVDGINVHEYGAHIFHTSIKPVWDYVNRFAEFNNYVNSPVAVYKDRALQHAVQHEHVLQDVGHPHACRGCGHHRGAEGCVRGGKSRQPRGAGAFPGGTRHLREAGEGYTEKQWGRDCKELPASIIRRLPVRFTYDNNYFNDRWQGIPMGGYTAMVERMFGDTDTLLDTEYKEFIAEHDGIADRVIYCGPIDEYFDYKLGNLEYRSLRFESEKLECENWQGATPW